MSWSNCYVFLPGTNTAAMPRGGLAAYRWPGLSNIVSDGSWCDRSMIIGPCDLRETNSLCSHEPTGGCDRHAFLVSTSAMPWSWIASKMNSWQVRDILNYGLYAW